MSSKKTKTDLLVRQRFQNPLPAPSFPPKLLTIRTDPARYATYDFLVPLSMERPVPMIVDAEGGMPLDPNLVPGYWEALASQGRSARMAPSMADLEAHPAEMDDEDLALLVDPPGEGKSLAAGMLNPANSGASMELVGSGAISANATTSALDSRKSKHHVAFVRRNPIKEVQETGNAARREAEAVKANKQVTAEQTLEQQIEAITSTFDALATTPLSEVRHPTKPYLEAVETFDLLPDEILAANQYMLFKFSDNPLADRGATAGSGGSAASTSLALFRPMEPNAEEGGQPRVGYFLPESESVAAAYSARRRDGKTVDTDILNGTEELDDLADAEAEQAAQEDADGMEDRAGHGFGFRFMRDYDAQRREAKSEYIIMLQEEDEPAGPSTSKGSNGAAEAGRRSRGAYYAPLSGYSMLRKRRARKGEAKNDYSDLDQEFWAGVLVTLGGKRALLEGVSGGEPDANPEVEADILRAQGQDEIDGRREELELLLRPPTEADAVPADDPNEAKAAQSPVQAAPAAGEVVPVEGRNGMQ